MENQIAKSASRTHGGGGGREDCWSEEATEVLIDSWGDRYLKLNRGNLRQKDWKEVADAVNSRRDGVRPPRTDVQCKNRVDTLKKKYKQEKSKPSSSKWPFYHHLEHLIGANTVTVSKKSTLSSLQKPQSLSLIVKSEPKASSNPITYSNSSESNESSLGGGSGGGVMKHSLEPVDFTAETAYKELAKAILRFGEIYERIESSKQKQILELEKQRMEFTKELECQRMNMFMEAQLQLEKVKLPTKNASSTGNPKFLKVVFGNRNRFRFGGSNSVDPNTAL